MLRFVSLLFSLLLITCFSCQRSELTNLSPEGINNILAQFNENDAVFTQKDVEFDSINTLAGIRDYSNVQQRVKVKLFYFGDYARGYFNVSDIDDSNLQIFGKKIQDYWAFKCVTKINMEEVGGYIILKKNNSGIWSNGHINFNIEKINLTKQMVDYNNLTNW